MFTFRELVAAEEFSFIQPPPPSLNPPPSLLLPRRLIIYQQVCQVVSSNECLWAGAARPHWLRAGSLYNLLLQYTVRGRRPAREAQQQSLCASVASASWTML
ncbi:unnamed protein product [Danaus chrysippus]|uniref:(African queen) hypothetical protein n=1 Tax=Danaus chrysippus TaxID=151541 RepID=A0A8J2W521_9NEOP|nr:unnamed protein product [Danaus chrysippus]